MVGPIVCLVWGWPLFWPRMGICTWVAFPTGIIHLRVQTLPRALLPVPFLLPLCPFEGYVLPEHAFSSVSTRLPLIIGLQRFHLWQQLTPACEPSSKLMCSHYNTGRDSIDSVAGATGGRVGACNVRPMPSLGAPPLCLETP